MKSIIQYEIINTLQFFNKINRDSKYEQRMLNRYISCLLSLLSLTFMCQGDEHIHKYIENYLEYIKKDVNNFITQPKFVGHGCML